MKGYCNPNMASNMELAACLVTPFKSRLASAMCWYGVLAAV